MKKFIFLFLILFITSLTTNLNSKDKPQNISSIHVSLGIPIDNDSTDDYLIFRPQYVLSYNKNKNVANWVAWELNADWFGSVARYKGNFITDTSLPTNFYKVKHSDYTNSGFDRGHLVMSEERTATVEDNKSTFILSNIIPQIPDLNRGLWLNFEKFCNNLALNQNKELFIFAGAVFHTSNFMNGKIAIPDSCWKIVVVLEKDEGINDVNVNTTVYSVMIPNINGVRHDKWEKYKTTIRRIESSTGYNFLNAVSVDVQNVIENK